MNLYRCTLLEVKVQLFSLYDCQNIFAMQEFGPTSVIENSTVPNVVSYIYNQDHIVHFLNRLTNVSAWDR